MDGKKDLLTNAQAALFSALFGDCDALLKRTELLKKELPEAIAAAQEHLTEAAQQQMRLLEMQHLRHGERGQEQARQIVESQRGQNNLFAQQSAKLEEMMGYLVSAADNLKATGVQAEKSIVKLIEARTELMKPTMQQIAGKAVEDALKEKIAALKTATDEHREATLEVNEAARVKFYYRLLGYAISSAIGGLCAVALLKFFP